MTAGRSTLQFCRAGARTVLGAAFATSPLRLLAPRNHGSFAWVYLVNLGGGLVDGDAIAIDVEVREGALGLLATQACTKVYRSPRGCSQRVRATVAEGGALAIVSDPVVCFAGARYDQDLDVALEAGASLLLLDGYVAGRRARGEEWRFERYASRTALRREGSLALLDATRLDQEDAPVDERMAPFGVVLMLLAVGPQMAPVRAELLAEPPRGAYDASTLVAASPLGADGAVLRVVAERPESAMGVVRARWSAAARVLGDDPLARKW